MFRVSHILKPLSHAGATMCQLHSVQGPSQDLENGCSNFRGGPPFTHISTINMYKLIKIRHKVFIQCHLNYMEMKEFNL